MSTLLMHNIEPFFCSNTSNNSHNHSNNNTTTNGHNNDHEDHLSYPNVSGVHGFHESLANFGLDSDAISNGGGDGHGNDSSPLNNHHHHHHHDYHHDLYPNGNYHHLLTIQTANDDHHHHPDQNNHLSILDGNNQELLESQLVQHYTATTVATGGCGFSTANHTSNDIKTEFILDEYNNNNNNNHNHHHSNNHEINCLTCILDDYPIQIESNSSPSPVSSSSTWLVKSPEQWLPAEVAQWIRGWAQRNEIQDIEVAHLLYNQMGGLELCQMQREYFTTVCPQYGDLIFDSLQSLLQQFRSCTGQSTTMHHPTSTISTNGSSSCFTISSSSVTNNIHCMEDNNTSDDNNNNDRPATRETESISPCKTLMASNDLHQDHHHHHHDHHQKQHHHNLLPVMGVYCNNNNVDLLSTVSAAVNIFEGSSPPTTMDHTHQQHSPSYAFDSDDRESTSSTYSNDRKISLNSTTYYHSSPQSTTSSILNNPQIHLQQQQQQQQQENNINDPFNENNGVSALKQHRSNNNNHGLLNNNNNGRRGRPPKKENKSRSKGNGKLWEFIRDLLLNPNTNPSLIRWERREDGIFKFIQSDKVAKMWGERKQNPRMTYEKLSRAMRYYYKSQVLLPVFGRRLVYKFGPNATGWRPTNHGSPVHYDNSKNDNNENIDYSTTTIITCSN